VPFFAHLAHCFPLRHKVRKVCSMALAYNCQLKTMNCGIPVWVPSIPYPSLQQESADQLSEKGWSQVVCSVWMAGYTSQNPSDGCVALLSVQQPH